MTSTFKIDFYFKSDNFIFLVHLQLSSNMNTNDNAKIFRIFSSPYWWKQKAETLKCAGELCRKDKLDLINELHELTQKNDHKAIEEFMDKRGLGTGDVD